MFLIYICQQKEMGKFWILLFVMLLSTKTYSQKVWTLKECIEYAKKNSIKIKEQNNKIVQFQIENSTLKSSRLPDLNSSLSQRLDLGRSLNYNNEYQDASEQTSSFSLSSEIQLFNGFKTSNNLNKNKYDLLSSEANKEVIENNLALNVTTYYFQILLNQEILKINEAQIDLSKEQEDRTKFLIKYGKAALSELYDVRAQMANDEQSVVEAKNNLKLSILDLMQLMELPYQENFHISSVSDTISNSCIINTPNSIYNISLSCMPQIKQANYSLDSYLQAIKVARSGYYPIVTLGAGISSACYFVSKVDNQSFGKQLNNNLQKSIYLSVSIPLFDRFSTRNAIRSAKFDVVNARLSLENEKKELYKDIEKAYTDAIAAYEKYKATVKSVGASEIAQRYAMDKYAVGKCTPYEYNQSKMKLAEAESNKAQAMYTFMLKRKVLEFYSCVPL